MGHGLQWMPQVAANVPARSKTGCHGASQCSCQPLTPGGRGKERGARILSLGSSWVGLPQHVQRLTTRHNLALHAVCLDGELNQVLCAKMNPRKYDKAMTTTDHVQLSHDINKTFHSSIVADNLVASGANGTNHVVLDQDCWTDIPSTSPSNPHT